MRYIVLDNGRTGDKVLASDVGVLAGDSCSPTLFSFYFGDLRLIDRPGDVILDGRRVKNLEQADDGDLLGHILGPLQDRLTEFVRYAMLKNLHPNILKTEAVAF
ncbi:hypothetical protein EV122DRAFT_226554, partial [Schizophyllum commune]